MPFSDDATNECWEPIGNPTQSEKGTRHPMFAKQLQDPVGISLDPTW
jgi:hypothetical protein